MMVFTPVQVISRMHLNKPQQGASTIVVQDRGILLLDLGFLDSVFSQQMYVVSSE